MKSLATKSKGNKSNYSKDSLGGIYFCGYLIKGKHMYTLSINELIQYKSLLINF